MNPPSYIITIDGEDKIYERSKLLECLEHIKYEEYNHRTEQIEVKTFINTWIKKENDLDIRTCIVNEPKCKNPTVYNKWKDWKMNEYIFDTTDDKAVDYMINHVKMLCNYDVNIANQILDWIAHLFQYPEYKSYVPIFSGKQGSGKNLLLMWISLMMGAKKMYESSTPERDVWGNFNPVMLDCYLVHLCEFSRKNSFSYEPKIKNLVTDSNLTIRDLYKSPFQINSYHKFIGSTNSNDPIPLEASNRRYMIILTSSDKIGDTKYFKQGWEYANDNRALWSMFMFFMKRPVNKRLDFHSLKQSDYQEHLMQYTQSKTLLWLKKFVMEDGYENPPKKKLEETTRDLYIDFKKFFTRQWF